MKVLPIKKYPKECQKRFPKKTNKEMLKKSPKKVLKRVPKKGSKKGLQKVQIKVMSLFKALKKEPKKVFFSSEKCKKEHFK